MNKLIKIINEEISAVRKDKKQEIFNYHSLANTAWNKKNKQAQKFQKINFDLENDDSTGQKKTFYVKKNLRKDQPIKDEFNVELMEAGGDWEMPVLYFRIEFTHQYGLLDNKYQKNPEFVWDLKDEYGGLSNCYVLIPPVEAGNKLTKNYEESSTGTPKDFEWFAYQNNDLSKEDEKKARITDEDKEKAWEWIQDLLEKLVNDRHEMLDEPDDDNTPKDSAD
jgi:hypothetical protein